MKIISADFIYTANGFIENQAVAFTETIKDIDNLEVLQAKFHCAKIIQ